MSLDVEKAVAALNEAFRQDPAAVLALICNRVPCNEALADHPTVQVDVIPVLGETYYMVTTLGLLNGAIEAMTGMRIATKWSDELDDDGRHKFLGFCVYTG